MLIKDIGHLVGFGEGAPGKLSGPEMRQLSVIKDGWLALEEGRVIGGGPMSEFPGIADWNDLEVVEASGRCVLPAWVDSHTHLVHAASREGEFVDRIRGLSYQEIAANGGGILNSARALRAMSEDALFAVSLERMERLMRMGTGAIEVKSGYGLDLESELNMLRVARRLGALDRIPVKTTFLGCHAVPDGWNGPADYTDYMVREVLPAIVSEGLADHVDLVCEDGYFGLDETRTLLEAAKLRGLPAKVHVNQFKATGRGRPLRRIWRFECGPFGSFARRGCGRTRHRQYHARRAAFVFFVFGLALYAGPCPGGCGVCLGDCNGL